MSDVHRLEPDSISSRFISSLSFPLDGFQREAMAHVDAGHSVLVAAPTGSGKTLVAEYAIARTMAKGARAFYTTPLKALSNQKYRDLARSYGEQAVGILTGDVSLNGEAPIVIMTTEVLRNMIYAGNTDLSDLDLVVLDEVHYLEDRYRGSVWEEIILAAPSQVRFVCLSATVSNAEELAAWINSVRDTTGAVIEERRPVELRHLYVVGRRNDLPDLLPTFVDGRPNPEAAAYDRRDFARRPPPPRRGAAPRPRPSHLRPSRRDVVERFAEEKLLPAIYFVFSRQGCDDAVAQCLDAGIRLTSPAERERIRAIVDDHVAELSDEDLPVLGFGRFIAGLEAGIAPHHAGMVPPLREAVEALFGEAVVKVVFATETLSLGINMPARSVVIENLSKYGGSGHVDLTSGEYTQLTGRAGRRGIDDVGYAGVLWSPLHTFSDVASLASARTRALRSSFRPTYNMTVNLVRRYDKDAAYRFVRSSFAQFLSSTPLERQLDAVLSVLEPRGYVAGWRLTSAGRRLAGIYHDCDLLVSEAIGSGILNGLDSYSMAAVVSAFTFEARRPGQGVEPPTAKTARRIQDLEALAQVLRGEERAAGVARTRAIDGGFAQLAYEWAKGAELSHLIEPPGHRRRSREAPPISAGDFVRNVKQLIDLLRQIGTVAEDDRAARVARQAADELLRGVIVASSGVGVLADDELDDEEDGEVEDEEIEVVDDPR